jgi:membrane associated rhomboid family serine protease
MSDSATVTQTDSTAPVRLLRLPQIAASRSPSFGRDILILFVVPALILTAIFVTTDPATFEYDIANPGLWGIYMSNLSHRSWLHLGSNLVGFFLIGGLEYLLLTAAGYRAHYIGIFLLSLLIVPLFSHLFLQFVLIHQPVFHSYEAVGFSEPIAAMAACLPLAFTTYCSRVSGLRWPFLTALLLYSGGVAWAINQLFGTDLSTILVGMLGIAGVTLVVVHLYRTRAFDPLERREYFVTSLFALLTFGTALLSLFAGTNVGTMVGHLAGFLPGFFLALIIVWGFTIAKPGHEYAISRGDDRN